MKQANVADLRNKFRKISAWIEDGHAVEIRKRGKPFAVLTRAEPDARARPCDIDWRGQLDEIWGERVFTTKDVERMRADEIEGEEG